MRRIEVFTNVIGSNRQFSMTSINQNSKLDRLGTTEIGDCIEGSANRAPGVEHVIHEHHPKTVEFARNVAAQQPRVTRIRVGFAIVPIEEDIEGTAGNALSGDLLNRAPETRGKDGRAIAVSDIGPPQQSPRYSPSIAPHSFKNSSWLLR